MPPILFIVWLLCKKSFFVLTFHRLFNGLKYSVTTVEAFPFPYKCFELCSPLESIAHHPAVRFFIKLELQVSYCEISMSLISLATEKERELLDALEPPANEASMKMPPMSLETMMATLLPSIPSTQRIPKSQKDVDRKHLSEEAIQVLSKLPDLSFMQAKVLMFPLKDIASN